MATATLNKIRYFRRSRGDACQLIYKLEVGVDNYDHTEVSHPANRGTLEHLQYTRFLARANLLA